MGTAPVITDDELVLGESGAIVQYLVARYGEGRLHVPSNHADFAHYLFWLHFANGCAAARAPSFGQLAGASRGCGTGFEEIHL